jgi:CBS domain-containing protein
MNLEQISSRPVIRAPRSSSLRQAALLMRRHHVGALVVTDDPPQQRSVVGFVTDRDLVLQAAAEGIGPDDATLADVMTEGLVTIERGAGAHAAMEAMRQNGVRRLGVTDDNGVVVGIVSFDDLVAAVAVELASLAGVIESEREREAQQDDSGEAGVSELAGD